MSNVRTAVEKRDAAVEAAPAAEPLHVLARKAIERQAVVLQQILPQHMSMERFEQIALAQVKGTPGLLRCFETPEGQVSLLYSVVQAAAAGLELGSVAQQAWLIPYQRNVKVLDEQGRAVRDSRGKDVWLKRTEARLQISDRGVRTLAARDPRVRELVADVVREGDRFTYRRTLDGDIFEHEVTGPSDRPLTHAYCLIRWRDGGALPIVMDRAEIEYIRDTYSEGWKGELDKPADKRSNPWSKREARMWIKTVIHQARRELNVSPEVAAVLASDADGNAAPVVAWPEATATNPDPAAVGRDAMRGAAELPWVDADTGEVLRADGAAGVWDSNPEPPAPKAGALSTKLPPDSPVPETVPDDEIVDVEIEPHSVQVSDLIEVGISSGRIKTKGIGNQRDELMALAAELVGVTVDDHNELVADQAVAEELLAKLTTAGQ